MCTQLHLVFFLYPFFHVDVCYVHKHVFMYVGLHVYMCYMHVEAEINASSHPQSLSHLIHWGRVSQSNLELANMTNFTDQLALGRVSHLCLLRLELEVSHCTHLAYM